MKGRIIMYGWTLSVALLMFGLALIEWAMETGAHVLLIGLAMVITFVAFSYLLVSHSKDVDAAHAEFEQWLERMIEK